MNDLIATAAVLAAYLVGFAMAVISIRTQKPSFASLTAATVTAAAILLVLILGVLTIAKLGGAA